MLPEKNKHVAIFDDPCEDREISKRSFLVLAKKEIAWISVSRKCRKNAAENSRNEITMEFDKYWI